MKNIGLCHLSSTQMFFLGSLSSEMLTGGDDLLNPFDLELVDFMDHVCTFEQYQNQVLLLIVQYYDG